MEAIVAFAVAAEAVAAMAAAHNNQILPDSVALAVALAAVAERCRQQWQWHTTIKRADAERFSVQLGSGR